MYKRQVLRDELDNINEENKALKGHEAEHVKRLTDMEYELQQARNALVETQAQRDQFRSERDS